MKIVNTEDTKYKYLMGSGKFVQDKMDDWLRNNRGITIVDIQYQRQGNGNSGNSGNSGNIVHIIYKT